MNIEVAENARILVVEDEPVISMIVTKRLGALGYSVTDVATSGGEAIRKALSGEVDLVLMDIGLPGEIDGIKAADQIRIMGDIPVIYMTAFTDPKTLNRAKATQPYGYVIKPFKDDTLRSTIEMALYKHRMESRLRRSEELLSTILGSIGDAVIATDTSGFVTFMNQVAEEMTGWLQQEARGKALGDVYRSVEEKSRRARECPVAKVLRTACSLELSPRAILVSRDGVERMITDSGATIRDRKNRVSGVVLVFRDITEKLAMEEELFKAQRIESIGLLAGGIAHDFNNLLAAILGNISLAKAYTPNDARVSRNLEEAEKASLRAKDLTQQLLTFSKGGAPVKKTASIVEIIRDSAAFALSGAAVACNVDIPPDLWAAEVDTGQISQVMNNLILNAAQAMPHGGVVEVLCRNLPAGSPEAPPGARGNYVMISVMDHGMGISAETLPRIFDPYFSTKEKGKGLGLATVYSIVKNHGGHITVDSIPGCGSTFRVYLLSPATPAAPAEEQDSGLPMGQGRILVMDDEKHVRDVVAEMLNLLGYQVESTSDGREAVSAYGQALAGGNPFSAVLMDLTIPGGMGGKEAVVMLREMDPEVKAIISSGYSNDPVMAEFEKYGFSGVILKPFNINELGRVLREADGG